MTVVLNGKVVDEIDLTTLKDGEITPDGSAMPKRLPGKQWSKMPL